MKKGFLLSITTLYYVVLFIIFLSFIVLISNKFIFVGEARTQIQRNNNLFIQGQDSVLQTTDFYWCSNHLSAYDANIDLGNQSPLEYKIYCEGYDGKRII